MRFALVFGVQLLYGVCAAGLAVYSLHALWLVWQVRKAVSLPQPAPPPLWPAVTVQLPIFNERHVATRLIDACARLEYPVDQLQLQILDDSTDDTVGMVEHCAAGWQAQGLQVKVVRRSDRSGYKAGALSNALPAATGQFIAIFDADFCPDPTFLLRTIPYFLAPEAARVGFVQSRWGHLNRSYSPLTQSQALALDGHFAVEQAGRQAAGCLLGFNGSAGVWRRSCLEDPQVGGWQADTLCEDLDLSYRAQLAGWQPRYLNDVVAPAEIPPQLTAYKRQQFRWAKGSIQTLRKLAGPVWGAHRPLQIRLAALVHLASYLIHPLLLLLLLATPPLLLFGSQVPSPLSLVGLTSLGPPLLYAVAQKRLYGTRWWHHWVYLPLLTLVGMGVCLNNSLAVWQGWRTRGGAFQRTPKFCVEQTADRWQGSSYALPLDRVMVAELLLALYAATAAWLVVSTHGWAAAALLLLYAASFTTAVAASLWQNTPFQRRLWPALRPTSRTPPLQRDPT